MLRIIVIITRLYWLIVMSQREKIEEVLRKAKELEKKYNWRKAVVFYEKALVSVGKTDFLMKGQIEETTGYCFYRAAFQAETREEFRSYMQLAVEAYKRAIELFKRVKAAKKSLAKILHSRAMVAYVRHRFSSDPNTRGKLLDKCWRLEKNALKAYVEAGDQLGLGKTCVMIGQLSS